MTDLNEAYSLDIINTEPSPISSTFNGIKGELMRIIEYDSPIDLSFIEDIDFDLNDFNTKINELKKIIIEKYEQTCKLRVESDRMDSIHGKVAKFAMELEQYNLETKDKLELDLSCDEFKDKLVDINHELNLKVNTLKKLLSVSYNLAGIGTFRACPICLTKEVGYSIIPCGHTFCGDCISKSKGSTCCICRSTYTAQPLKLFYI